jgi:hypothetical protein
VVIEGSWAMGNGYINSGANRPGAGNGNGFKAGSSKTGIRHIIRNSLAWKNAAAGFYANHSSGGNDWFNNTSYNNGTQYDMLASDPTDSSITIILTGDKAHKMRNNIGFPNKTSNMDGVDTSFDTWDLGIVPAAADFVSLTDTGAMGPRQPDGSVPDIDFMKLPAGSKMIDKGTDVGLAFVGAAPDLGAFEHGTAPSGGSGGASGGAGGASAGAGGTVTGTSATGGTNNTGGGQAAGGGGPATASGGATGTTGTLPSDAAESAPGCGCKLTGKASPSPLARTLLPLLGALALLVDRRRRRVAAKRAKPLNSYGWTRHGPS